VPVVVVDCCTDSPAAAAAAAVPDSWRKLFIVSHIIAHTNIICNTTVQ